MVRLTKDDLAGNTATAAEGGAEPAAAAAGGGGSMDPHGWSELVREVNTLLQQIRGMQGMQQSPGAGGQPEPVGSGAGGAAAAQQDAGEQAYQQLQQVLQWLKQELGADATLADVEQWAEENKDMIKEMI